MSGRFCVTMAAVAVATLLVGCIADSTSSSGSTSNGGRGEIPSASASGGATTQPIVVDVDTNGTLIATPGEGIGIYVEYETGGHWQISWTCDTLVTSRSCSFSVDASIANTVGTIENAAGIAQTATDSLTTVSPVEVQAVTTTTSGIDRMSFDAPPGAVLTVSAQLDAPVSFFFVQDNQVNGGYTGALTNPLLFQPSSP